MNKQIELAQLNERINMLRRSLNQAEIMDFNLREQIKREQHVVADCVQHRRSNDK